MPILATSVRQLEMGRGWREWPWTTDILAAILFLGLGVGLILGPYVAGNNMPGDLGDTRFDLALLEFFYRSILAALHGNPVNFQNAPFFYPWPSVTNFADTFWGNAEIYAVVRAFGVGQLAAFQIWVVAGFGLTYASAVVTFRKFGLAAWGAASGAFLFTFALPMMAQLGHAQLIYRLWIPPAVLAFDNFLTRQSLLAGAACILFVALQLAVGIYLGLLLCLLLVSYGAALCLVGRNRLALPRLATLRTTGTVELMTTVALLISGLVVLSIVGFPYLRVQSMYGITRSWPEIVDGLPRAGSYLMVGISKIWPDLSGTFRYTLAFPKEHQLFPGLSAIIPFAWFLLSKNARARQSLAPLMLATVIILLTATIYVGGHTLYRVIYLIPGFSAVRSVGRVILVMMLPFAVLFGLMIDDCTSSGEYRWPRCFVALALSVFLVAECSLINPGDSTAASWRTRFEAIEARLPNKLAPHAVLAVASLPINQGAGGDSWLLPQIDAELAAVTLGIKTLNGYSAYLPPTWKTMTTCADVGDNIRAGRHFLAEHELPEAEISPDQVVLLGFGSCDLTGLGRDPVLQLGHPYHFAKGADGNSLIGRGFSAPESWGRWTDAKNAFLYFSLADLPQRPISLEIDANTPSAAADYRQEVTVVANAQICGQLVLADGTPHAKVVCPANAFRSGNNTLRFRVARPTRPTDLGLDRGDKQHLGLALKALTLTPSE